MSKAPFPTLSDTSAPCQSLDGRQFSHFPAKTAKNGSEAEQMVELCEGVRVGLLHQGKRFRGLGRVEVNGVLLRGSRRPMFVELRTPEGIEFFDFELKSKTEAGSTIVLEFAMKARSSGLQDWMVHSVRNLLVTRDWAAEEWIPRETVLRLHLRGIEKNCCGRTFRGFEYFYDYESPEHPIYRLLDRSSWAIGGSIVRNTFWLRSAFAPSIKRFSGLEEFYSTEWYLGQISNPNIFQFLPFQTNMESFTMTTAEQGQLLTVAPHLSHLRSFFEKPADTEEMLHWHEHCGDLSHKFSTTPIEILFCDRPASPAELINLNEAVRNEVSDGLHLQAGLRRERITTYGVIEEWTKPDLDDYTDRILPKFLENGVRCVFLPNEFKNNMNVWDVGNMCCTLDYKMADQTEENKLRRFCARARAGGAEVQMWGNTAVSTLDFILGERVKDPSGRVDFSPVKGSIFEVLRSADEPYIRNPSGAIEADHYTPVFAVLNLRDPAIVAYWHRCWKGAREHLGLNGLFLDSSFNLSSDKFHFCYNSAIHKNGATIDQTQLLGQSRPAKEAPKSILTMYHAHLQLIAGMQGYGYHYSGEDIGVFGLHKAGPGVETRLDNLFLWGDCYTFFDRRAILAAERDPDEIFFQGLAYRMMWILYWNFERQTISFCITGGSCEDNPTSWHLNLLRVFNEVEPLLVNRTVLEGEYGVIYGSPENKILWAFTPFDFELPSGATALEILTGKTFDGPCVHVQRHQVYRIRPACV